MNSKPSIDELVELFAKSVMLQNKSEVAGSGNMHAKKYVNSFETLVELYGDTGRDGLAVLFGHADPAVRCMAAAFLLRHKHDEAMSVLRELASGNNVTAFAAECSMTNWENGDWELDPVDA